MNGKRRLAGTLSRPNRHVETVLPGADFDGAIIVEQSVTDNTSEHGCASAIRIGIMPGLVAYMEARGLLPAEIMLCSVGGKVARFRCADDPPGEYPGWITFACDGPPSAAFGHYPRGIYGHSRVLIAHGGKDACPSHPLVGRRF